MTVARITQQALEVLLSGHPSALLTQQALEVLRSTWEAYPVTVAIANPGAESFTTGNEPSSWTETSGDWESLTSVGGDFPIASAKEGSRFFYQQGAVAEAVLEQTVELYNVPKNDLDAGSLTARLAAWQAHNYPGDQGQVIAEFLDPDGIALGTIATPLQHVGTSGWVEVTASGAVPPGARQVRVKLRAVLVEGSVPNLAFDDLSLVIEEHASNGSGGQSAVLVVVLM
jgi:hypothetical protein